MPIRPLPDSAAGALRRFVLLIPVLAALGALAAPAAAQTPDSVRPLTVRDSGSVRRAAPDTTENFRVAPGRAFLHSLVLPGWGQSELGAPGRGGVYFTLEAGSLWMWLTAHQKLREAREQQSLLRRTGQIAPDAKTGLVRSRENQREDWITLSIFWLFFSGADAFVAAHLQDFDVHVNAIPRPGGATELRATVPLPR
ncbi:DUF5683 domain-containing protein [Longimicrobium terrae]|uniref:DUF5683 domain-containing protein n=1 Tax=Longimicrobium terrae TaxID=1639882 RepID=A0A841GVF4_9BACT|nr:DUF5683 domain-containing protein [Longimicrobium terrae]MBB4634898.1 hypothetical protein [Longimicrobium terrae]MBB6069293.1 hypothetical protein [Longimicrobium terrae]NNC31898.1 hypothetical protein [Longimicrobium terrae]